MLLSLAPQYQRRHIDRILKGRAIYQPCFDRHQALFIHVPKSAGRSIVRGLFDVKSVEHAPADWYQQLDPERFERYFKFTFVRNPWDRAVSAYTYLKNGGSAASPEDARWAQFVNRFSCFDEFVSNWMNEDNIMRNALFTPHHKFLDDMFGQPCMDFVGRFENLEQDFAHIAEKLKVPGQLPHLNKSREKPYQDFYTQSTKDIVALLYRRDIEQYEYEFDSSALHSSC